MSPAEQSAYRHLFEQSIRSCLCGMEGTALERDADNPHNYNKPYMQAAWKTYLALAEKRARPSQVITEQADDLDAFEDEYARAFGPITGDFFKRTTTVGGDIYTGSAAAAYRGWLCAEARTNREKPPADMLDRRTEILLIGIDMLRPFIEEWLEYAAEEKSENRMVKRASRIMRAFLKFFGDVTK